MLLPGYCRSTSSSVRLSSVRLHPWSDFVFSIYYRPSTSSSVRLRLPTEVLGIIVVPRTSSSDFALSKYCRPRLCPQYILSSLGLRPQAKVLRRKSSPTSHDTHKPQEQSNSQSPYSPPPTESTLPSHQESPQPPHFS